MKNSRLYILRILGLGLLLFTGYIVYYTIGSGQPRNFWRDSFRPRVNLYEMPGEFESQTGKKIKLSDFRGQPTIFSFVYLKCRLSCPVIMAELIKLKKQIGLSRARFVVFLLDNSRQNKQDLEEFFKIYAQSSNDWLVLQTSPEELYAIASKFDLQYEEAGAGRFDYKHTNFFAVAKSGGAVALEVRGFEKDSESFYKKVESVLEQEP